MALLRSYNPQRLDRKTYIVPLFETEASPLAIWATVHLFPKSATSQVLPATQERNGSSDV